MKTFTVTRDVLYGGIPQIIATQADLDKAQAGLKTQLKTAKGDMKLATEGALATIQRCLDERKTSAEKIRSEVVTVKVPSPEDRIEIHAMSKTEGQYDMAREPLFACIRLIQSWTLLGDDGKELPCNEAAIREDMPMCLLDAVYGEVRPYLYPAEARMAFLARSGD